MPKKLCTLLLFTILTGLPLLTGCGSSDPQLAPVTGTVSYQGAPLNSGTIVFTPDAARGFRGPLAHAEIQSDGRFVLTSGEAKGAAVGWHRITIVAVHDPEPPTSGQRFFIPQNMLPEKYGCPDLSGLTREVKGGQENVIHIELE